MLTTTITTPGTTSGGQSEGFVIGGLNLDPSALAGDAGTGFELTASDMGLPEPGVTPPAVTTTTATPEPGVMHVPATEPVIEEQQYQQTQQTPAVATVPATTAATVPAVTTAATAPATPATTQDIMQAALSLIPQTVQQTLAAQQQSQQLQQPQFTAEELDLKFSVIRLKPEDMAKLGLAPEAAPVLEGLLHAAAKMGASVAQHHTESQVTAVRETFRPALTYTQQQAAVQLENDFYTQHADLKEYKPLVIAVQAQLSQTGFRGSREQAFAAVATNAKALLAKVQGSGGATTVAGAGTQQLPVGQQQQQQTQLGQQPVDPQTSHRMSTLSGGGQGGAASGTSNGTPKQDLAWKAWE